MFQIGKEKLRLKGYGILRRSAFVTVQSGTEACVVEAAVQLALDVITPLVNLSK